MMLEEGQSVIAMLVAESGDEATESGRTSVLTATRTATASAPPLANTPATAGAPRA
jgi:hypothetical protein